MMVPHAMQVVHAYTVGHLRHVCAKQQRQPSTRASCTRETEFEHPAARPSQMPIGCRPPLACLRCHIDSRRPPGPVPVPLLQRTCILRVQSHNCLLADGATYAWAEPLLAGPAIWQKAMVCLEVAADRKTKLRSSQLSSACAISHASCTTGHARSGSSCMYASTLHVCE